MISNGVDIIEIDRIKHSIEKESFKLRVYGQQELKELESKKPESYAGAFCAKEAFSKALGTGLRDFNLNEVQVLHDELGKPYFHLSGKAKEIVESKKMKFSLSISHCEKYAIAMVTAFTED